MSFVYFLGSNSDHVNCFVTITGSPNFGSWKGAISTDSLAPGPSAVVSDYLVLAADRTKRPDILRAFKPYHGGWNITNNHYWAVSLSSLSPVLCWTDDFFSCRICSNGHSAVCWIYRCSWFHSSCCLALVFWLSSCCISLLQMESM